MLRCLPLGGAGAAMAQEGPVCTVKTVDGRSLEGRVTVDASGVVHVTPEKGDAQTLQFADLREIDESQAVKAAIPELADKVWLRAGGQILATRVVGPTAPAAGKETVPSTELTLPAGVQLAMPLRHVAAIRFAREGAPEPATLDADLDQPSPTNDFLYVAHDGRALRVSVTIDRMTADKLEFTLRGQASSTPLDTVIAIVFGKSSGFAPDRQPKPRASVLLASGDRLEGKLLGLEKTCRLRLDEGPTVELPREQVMSVAVATDKLTWLSDLQPKVEQVPAFDRVWPWTKDRSPVGPGIRLGDKNYEHGLVMVPKTVLTYRLDGRYDLFEATIGIESRGGPQANAVFRVLVDSKVAYESPAMTLGKAPETVRLPLGKCKQLALEVDFGKNFDLGDLCVFADARVIQQ
jgi:NPCBM/NEW2 domain